MSDTELKAELRRVIEFLDEGQASTVLDIVMMQLEPEGEVSDEEYADALAGLAEIRAGNFITGEEFRAKYGL